MKVVYTLLLAALVLACVIISDFLLKKIPAESKAGKFTANKNIRMAASYLLGLAVFLAGVRVFSVLV